MDIWLQAAADDLQEYADGCNADYLREIVQRIRLRPAGGVGGSTWKRCRSVWLSTNFAEDAGRRNSPCGACARKLPGRKVGGEWYVDRAA